MEQEEWRPVVGFPRYHVSSLGRIRAPGGGFMKPQHIKGGYLRVCLFDKGRYHKKLVSHLVLEAFVGLRPAGAQARHVHDNDRTNNKVYNLAWGSAKQNADDRDRHGTTARGERQGAHTRPETVRRGSNHHNARLTPEKVRQIREERARGLKLAEIGRKHGVTESMVWRIEKRLAWSHV